MASVPFAVAQSRSDLPAELRAELAAWERAGLRRHLSLPQGRDFSSNDYLALSRDPRLIAAARAALERYGAGAPSARLLRGNLPVHAEAEHAAAEWLRAEAALLLPSGWQANLALISTVAGPEDVILSDQLNHASLIDGCRMSRARVRVFRHNDPEDLERGLRRAAGARRRFVLVESVFSMDGDLAPLGALEQLAAEHDAWLLVDEAHAVGLYGPESSGRCEELGVRERLLARVFTGGKALGVCGGFVAGSRTLVELLLNKGRAFVFTTATTPATAAALAAAISSARGQPERAQRALQAAGRLRSALAHAGIPSPGESPIVPVILGAAERALRVAERVRAAGFDVRAVRYPTVARGSSRLRIVCHADHGEPEIDGLAAAVAAAMAEVPAPPAEESRAPAAAPALVVAGTDTGVGKTVVSALLLRAARRAGLPARYWKPVQTGADSDTDAVVALSGLAALDALPPAFSLPLAASVDQAAAHAGVRVEARALLEVARRRRLSGGFWIFECAGGLRVPLNETEDQSDFLAALRAPLVLAARTALGTLNHTLLTLESAQARSLDVRALFLVGPPHPDNAATLRARLDLPIFELPLLEPLTPTALDSWLACNDLRPLWK